ncbi:hypothetical protein O181_018473 [Austropuccinia psidii MF-1]|uniref:Integrase catalytic domain-containing protein n=1 Tax=Austropuccinia psidii MF-1 TaxID=1389203 RepID=A0A9Q3C7Y6_9BASI|nr:hypothetical protein [Austropuccinia psidii MF-1]
MSFILENTLYLRTLFSGLTISPESLIDSIIAMWVIINLPNRFKTTMEVWLGKCKVEKKSPSLDDTWEVIRKFLQRCENNNEHSNQALLASKNNNTNNNQNKKETNFHIQKLIKCIENQCKEKITNLVSDNGSEFKNNQLTTFFQDNGIAQLTTAPYTPEQNAFAKTGNWTTITKARCLLSDSGVDKSFWAKAVRTFTYLENITPKKSLNYSTPYYKWFKRLPTYQHLQPFGCLFYYLNNQPQDKFSEKGSEGLFLEYKEGHRAYQILDRWTEPQITSGDLIVTNTVCPRDDHPKSPTENSLNPNLNTNMPRDKRGDNYKWIPENQTPANEIHGDVGDPKSIIESR